VIMDDLYLGLGRLHDLMAMRHLGNEGLPYQEERMGVVGNLRMMVLLKLAGRQSQRKVVSELAVEVGVGDSDYANLVQRVEGTWHLLLGKHRLRPLMM